MPAKNAEEARIEGYSSEIADSTISFARSLGEIGDSALSMNHLAEARQRWAANIRLSGPTAAEAVGAMVTNIK